MKRFGSPDLARLFVGGTVAGLGEGELLDRFVSGRDEAAFAALVARHGPMVLGVCRRVLRDGHDVEDAFQATFLVLVRRAGAIRDGALVGHWLHGVARRVAVRARAQAARRSAREPTGIEADRVGTGPIGEDAAPDLRAVLDEELARLPDSLRAPMVLCYLEGLTHDEAAQRLGWPVGTVRSRMARGRDRLRGRLARRGLAVGVAALASALAPARVSAALLGSTIRASLTFSADRAATVALASARAAALAQGALHAMTISKLKALGAATVACALALGTVPTLARQFGGVGQGAAPARAADKQDDIDRPVERLQAELKAVKAELAALKAAAKPDASPNQAARPGMPGMMGGGFAGPGLGQGMGGMAAGGPKRSHYVVGNQLVLITSLDGDKATAYSPETGKRKTIRLFEPNGLKHEAVPIVSMGVAVFDLTGPNITRLVAYNVADGTWYTQTLREPAERAMPIVSQSLAAYGIGRRIYAFSGPARRWGVLELPEGVKPQPIVGFEWVSFEHDGHLYIFSARTGKWVDINTLADPDPDAAEDAGGKPPGR